MNLSTLKEKIWACYTKELCYPKNRERWSPENPSYGMCAITALIVNDYFDGEIAKIYVDNDSHYRLILCNGLDVAAGASSLGYDFPREMRGRGDI